MRFTDQFMRVLLSIPWATVVSVYGREKAEKNRFVLEPWID